MSGGIGSGDVCSIIGRPAAGKTFLELYVSRHSWKHGGSPLVVSMEMSNLAISQRLAAMEAKKGLTQLLKGMMTNKGYMTLMDALDGNKDAARPYWLVDGNLTSTVDDIVLLARQLKPSSVLIDGAYLLKHQNNRLTKWDRISENAEMIKQRIAGDLGLPVVCSYQFSREVEKKKKKDGEKAGLGDIYGSDSIGQLSSLVLGLFEEENIETQKCRKVDILKGRKGETGEFLINWDFIGMDFSEIPTEMDATGKKVKSTKELQFL
jgi:replicative DNA helicase